MDRLFIAITLPWPFPSTSEQRSEARLLTIKINESEEGWSLLLFGHKLPLIA